MEQLHQYAWICLVAKPAYIRQVAQVSSQVLAGRCFADLHMALCCSFVNASVSPDTQISQDNLQATRSGFEIGAARADRLEAAQPDAQPSLPPTDLR